MTVYQSMPCGLRIKSSMTVWGAHTTLWIPAYAGMTGQAARRPSGVPIKSAMTVYQSMPCGYCIKSSMTVWGAHPTLWFPAYAGMTVRDAGMTGQAARRPSGLRIKSAMTVYQSMPCGYCIKSSMTVLFSPSAPVSSSGTGFGPLPSRERGMMDGVEQ